MDIIAKASVDCTPTCQTKSTFQVFLHLVFQIGCIRSLAELSDLCLGCCRRSHVKMLDAHALLVHSISASGHEGFATCRPSRVHSPSAAMDFDVASKCVQHVFSGSFIGILIISDNPHT